MHCWNGQTSHLHRCDAPFSPAPLVSQCAGAWHEVHPCCFQVVVPNLLISKLILLTLRGTDSTTAFSRLLFFCFDSQSRRQKLARAFRRFAALVALVPVTITRHGKAQSDRPRPVLLLKPALNSSSATTSYLSFSPTTPKSKCCPQRSLLRPSPRPISIERARPISVCRCGVAVYLTYPF